MNLTCHIYHAKVEPNLQVLRPLFAYVPPHLIQNGELETEQYVNERWAAINCAANQFGIGSHVFPDLDKLASKIEAAEFEKSLKAHIHKSKGKASPTKKPGKTDQPREM
jgi:hypothetical protein